MMASCILFAFASKLGDSLARCPQCAYATPILKLDEATSSQQLPVATNKVRVTATDAIVVILPPATRLLRKQCIIHPVCVSTLPTFASSGNAALACKDTRREDETSHDVHAVHDSEVEVTS